MAIEAPLSKYKRNDFKICIVVCLALAGWFAYDGYLNEGFIDKHTDEQGTADLDLVINRVAPPCLVAAAVLLGAYFYIVKDRKLVAEGSELVVAGKRRIPYDDIEKIDKTHFEEKGFFTIVYKDENGRELRQKLSARTYDDLGLILDHLVAQIT